MSPAQVLMIADIFLSFDPLAYTPKHLPLFNISFIPIIIPITIFLFFYLRPLWISQNQIHSSILLQLKFIWAQVRKTQYFHLKSGRHIISSLFLILIAINLIGLTPYTFSLSRHLLFTLSLALPLWLRTILSSLSWQPSKWLAHLLPTNSPNWLSPFLVTVETTRISVRPITLRFRLGANITAGHTVISLLSTYNIFILFSLPILILLATILIQTGYFIFETGICFIQAFIFGLLLTLYAEEHPH